jgi:hypothetical protein
MEEFIEQDALISTPETTTPPQTPHTHEVSSFVATPRTDQGFMQRIRSLFVSDLKPGMHVVHKDGEPLRLMVIVTSNSYEDRENETITSAALKEYEDSCHPGEDLFHCDNPLLWWHDDDIVMGEIIGVNYSEPFLIEVARELANPVSKVLFDYAEKNGDNAGASHRFGYLEKDRDTDGTYHRIFKQETSYLPERGLAANIGTYAGVIKMASQQSDKRINEIFEPLGIKDAAAKFHAKTGEIAKELEALGIAHKAAKPPMPPVEADAAAVATDEVVEEEEVVEEAKADMPGFMAIMNNISALVMDLVDAQMGGMETQAAFAKSLKALETTLEERQTAEKAAKSSLEDQIKTLTQQVEILEKRLNLAPRRVAEQPPVNPVAIAAAVGEAEKARATEGLVEDPIFGQLKPPIKYE